MANNRVHSARADQEVGEDESVMGKKTRHQTKCPECKGIIKGDAHSHGGGGRVEKERRSPGWTVNGEEDRA